MSRTIILYLLRKGFQRYWENYYKKVLPKTGWGPSTEFTVSEVELLRMNCPAQKFRNLVHYVRENLNAF